MMRTNRSAQDVACLAFALEVPTITDWKNYNRSS
eukprot:COSAG01_NODE_61427_length_289_cov_1.615789_1_plen_33_part_10